MCVSMNVCKYEFVLVCLCVSTNVLLEKSIQGLLLKSTERFADGNLEFLNSILQGR